MSDKERTEHSVKSNEIANQINLQDILNVCKRNWWWFVISVVVCIALGLLYFMKKVPVYERSELVLVMVQGSESNKFDAASMISSLSGNAVSPRKLNEMIGLTSPAVMIDVTKTLRLNVNYQKKGYWHNTPLYGTSLPFYMDFRSLGDNDGATVQATILPGGKVQLTSISSGKTGEQKVNITGNYLAGETIKTPLGPVSLMANPTYAGGKITKPIEIVVSRGGVYGTAMALTGRVKSEILEEKSDVIKLSIVDSNAERAEDILSTLTNVYITNWRKNGEQVAAQTARFIKDRLDSLEVELGSEEMRIAEYKSRNQMIDASANASNILSMQREANDRVTQLSNQMSMARYIRDFLAAASSSNTPMPIGTGLQNSSVESQIAEYNRLLFERNAMESSASANNPEVQRLEQQLDGLRRAMLQSLDNQITGINTQLSSAHRQENLSSSKISATPRQARHLLSAERQQKVKEELYLFLLKKREESTIAEALVPSKITVISPPNGSPSPLGPYRNNILFVAFIIGLALPLGIICLREMLNNRVRYRKDLEPLKVPFAGEIPIVKGTSINAIAKIFGKKKKDAGLCVSPGSMNYINEAFRVLRTNIELMARRIEGNNATVISLTSLYPGSGKTFISLNLAAALAVKGRRVLLLDMDLRRYTLSSMVCPKRHHNGLVDYLIGMPGADLEAITTRDINGISGFDVIPVGITPPNPTEIISDQRLAELISDLRKHYDYILFDCPPVDIVADPLVLNPLVDITLFVVRAGLYRRTHLPLIQEMYDNKKYNAMSVILNATSEDIDGYGYGYRYRHYYKQKDKEKDKQKNTKES